MPEIARLAWLLDQAAAREIVRAIEKSQPDFVPEAPAAPVSYRLIYQTFGFGVAQRLAAYKRYFSDRNLIPGEAETR